MFRLQHQRIVVVTVLSCFSFTTTASSQWYKVPSSGQVNFTLTEEWGIYKGPASQNLVFADSSVTVVYVDGEERLEGSANQNLVLGDATLTIGYSDGQQMQIAFQGSGFAISEQLAQAGYTEAGGVSTWTQVAYLNPGIVFRIMSATAAQAYDPTKPFEGGQLGAEALGHLRMISTDAAPSSGSDSRSTTNPPPLSVGSASLSNIHAVVISGLSDPAKIIPSSNVTLTGGIIALGKNSSPPPTPSSWSPGLKIIPDYALLTGEKIPPITPNIIDVRIVRQDVTADFPSAVPKPDN
jgi:hypothetical protein